MNRNVHMHLLVIKFSIVKDPVNDCSYAECVSPEVYIYGFESSSLNPKWERVCSACHHTTSIKNN